ncbi:hypothetical protein HKD37_10G028032 [Glycine soja]
MKYLNLAHQWAKRAFTTKHSFSPHSTTEESDRASSSRSRAKCEIKLGYNAQGIEFHSTPQCLFWEKSSGGGLPKLSLAQQEGSEDEAWIDSVQLGIEGKNQVEDPKEAMDLIENMAASDIAILRNRTHIPTKKSLLELTSQDALLAQNKLLSKQLEALTETLRCTICGGAHESGYCIPNEEQVTHEVNYMGNQPRNNFNAGGFSGFQHGQQYNQQQGQWKNHLGNQFNRDQGGSSIRSQQQGPSLYDRTTKMEKTPVQFMQVSMSNQKSTESAIKNLEVQVGQLTKQLADRSSRSFSANIEKNPKEECKAVMTRSRMATHVDERKAEKKMEEHKQQLAAEPTLKPVDDLVELEEVVEEAEGDEEGETPIRDYQEKIKKKEEKEKEEEIKEKEEKEKKLKNEKQKEKVVEIEKKKGKRVLSLCEEINRKRLRNIFAIVYPLSADLTLSAQSSCAKSSLLALSALTPNWLAE